MAEAHKAYPQSMAMLLNIANDIVEMYKANVTVDDGERFGFATEMYGNTTSYLFQVTEKPEGCQLTIETPGEGERAMRHLFFMFAVVDNMLAPVGKRKEHTASLAPE